MSEIPNAPSTHLLLVRHGATSANEQRPYVLQGQGVDLPLSDTGRKQASAVAEFLSRFGLSAVYCSPMRRAVETAGAIAACQGAEVQPIADLQECDVGRWEGLDWESIRREHPGAYRVFMENPAVFPYLGGESYQDVLQRIEPILTDLLNRHVGESIAVIAHNVVNRVYLARLLGLELRRARELTQTNACVNVIRFREGQASLVTMNADFHLGPVQQ